jgi:hypothetical protein
METNGAMLVRRRDRDLPWFADEARFLKQVEKEVLYIEAGESERKKHATGIFATSRPMATRVSSSTTRCASIWTWRNIPKNGVSKEKKSLTAWTRSHCSRRLVGGLWAYSEIEFSETEPKGYQKEDYCFVEVDTLADIYSDKYGFTDGGRHILTPSGKTFQLLSNEMYNMNHQHEENEKYADELWAKLKKLKSKVRKTKDSPARKSAK